MLKVSYSQKFLLSFCIFLLTTGLVLTERKAASAPSLTAPPQPGCPAGDPGVGLLPRPTPRQAAKSLASTKFSCLPKDVRADEIVSYGAKGRLNVTVAKKLGEMKARCRSGKLIDAKGRAVRFFRRSCWGNPPPDYLEIQKRETDELDKLKRRYTVIVFGCNPMIQ
jgi:hypothetical protein